MVALAFPTMEHQIREVMATDYFLDALGNPEFGLKIRKKIGKTWTPL